VAEEKDSGELLRRRWELTAEFELVTNALWTDPGDQSGWLYHRWLVGTSEYMRHYQHLHPSDPAPAVLERELANITELNDAEPDSKWCMNSLAHYLLLSARLESTAPAEATKRREQAKTLLERLAVIDEDRKERYRELGRLARTTRTDIAASQQ
jgi:geranylgeranyl transferase type-2 subunit alpha